MTNEERMRALRAEFERLKGRCEDRYIYLNMEGDYGGLHYLLVPWILVGERARPEDLLRMIDGHEDETYMGLETATELGFSEEQADELIGLDVFLGQNLSLEHTKDWKGLVKQMLDMPA